MTQLETLNQALEVVGEPEDEFEASIVGVLRATQEVKQWELEEGDASECECNQCVAAVAFAEQIIKAAAEETL